MSIPPAFLDEIRARVPVSEIVGRRVKLIRAGREMKACCPFHNEKTPSFYVNDDKAFYHCFGCGAHGDVLSFLIDGEGMEFRDAVATLAVEAGLSMPEESPESRERAKAAQGLHDIAGAAENWFRGRLAGPDGAAARAYLDERGVNEAMRDRFAIGFAPDSRGALAGAIEAPRDKLVAAGLLVQPDDEARDPYDRFRSRIVFPIHDTRGRTVGFGGRILGPGEPKYLNSPDGPLFDKGRLLYNLNRAAPAARKSGRLAVVEGYMDVVALAQAGFVEAVAPMGTAMTEDQMRLVWRAVPEPVLCFDGDAAGIRAATRAALRALPLLEPGKSLRFAVLPEGQDPDDLVRAAGIAAFERLLETAEPLIEHLWRIETEGADLATPERRAAVRKRLGEHASAIADGSVQQLYRSEFKARFDRMFVTQQGGTRSFGSPARFAGGASAAVRALADTRPYDGNVRAILAGLILHPQALEVCEEDVAALDIRDTDLARLRDAIFRSVSDDPALDKDALAHDLNARGLGQLAEQVVLANRLDFSFTRPRTPAAQAAEELASVAAHLMALAQMDIEEADLRARYDTLSEEEFERRTTLTYERLRIENELRGLAQGRREAAEAAAASASTDVT
ncbi:MAG: DNA primase [Pseudomonadota bacterium]